MIMRRKHKKLKLRWSKDQYVVDDKTKTIYLIGSFMRAMMISNKRDTLVPGYTIKLGTKEEVEQLRKEIDDA